MSTSINGCSISHRLDSTTQAGCEAGDFHVVDLLRPLSLVDLGTPWNSCNQRRSGRMFHNLVCKDQGIHACDCLLSNQMILQSLFYHKHGNKRHITQQEPWKLCIASKVRKNIGKCPSISVGREERLKVWLVSWIIFKFTSSMLESMSSNFPEQFARNFLSTGRQFSINFPAPSTHWVCVINTCMWLFAFLVLYQMSTTVSIDLCHYNYNEYLDYEKNRLFVWATILSELGLNWQLTLHANSHSATDYK